MFHVTRLFQTLIPTASCTLLKSHIPSGPARLPATALLCSMAQLQKAVVRSLPGEPNLTITLTVGGRQRNLDRPKAELLEKPLGRLQKAAVPPPDKRQKRSKSTAGAAAAEAEPAAPYVGLHGGPSAEHPLIDAAATTNEVAWQQGRVLCVGDTAYSVQLNPPMADGVSVHGTPFVGIPLVPVPQLHFAEAGDCEWAWYRGRGASWEAIEGARSRQYIPALADAGCWLRVACTPVQRSSAGSGSSAGAEAEVVLRGAAASAECGPVALPPVPSAGEGRHTWTSDYTRPPDLRVVTYNILADQYAATDTAKNVLFSHCPPQCLGPDYRRPLVLAELLGYRPDVAALQEVDETMFSQCLAPALGESGYDGAFTNKAGKVREGAAAFWRRERYSLAVRREVALKDLFPAAAGGDAKYAAAFDPMLRTSPALRAALQRVATVAQLLLLVPSGAAAARVPQSQGGAADDPALRPLCLVNTHLYFHYAAPHIRTIHVWALLQEAAELVEAAVTDPELRRRCGGRRPALLFCGDLNSDLNDGIPGAVELLSSGRLSADHWDWMFGAAFKWEKEEEGAEGGGVGEGGEVSNMVHTEVEGRRPRSPHSPTEIVAGVELQSPFALRAADGLRSQFTNYVRGYQGLLNYVWYEPGALEVRRVVPLPTLKDIGGYLPSPRFPSDHLAVVCELRFKAETGASKGEGSSGPDGTVSGGGSGGSGGGKESERGGGGSGSGAGGEKSKGDGDGGGALPAALFNVGVAAGAVRRGGVIAVPTDTVYGLAACANDGAGVQRIYRLKQRKGHKPLAVCVADPADVARYVEVSHLPPSLIQDLLPGPVTLLLTRRADAPLAHDLNAGVPTLGVRIPEHGFLRAVCRQHRGALALTSANLSGAPASTAVAEFRSMWAQCEAVFDGGELRAGRSGSTVVDLTGPGRFSIFRRGAGLEELLRTLRDKHGLTQEDQ